MPGAGSSVPHLQEMRRASCLTACWQGLFFKQAANDKDIARQRRRWLQTSHDLGLKQTPSGFPFVALCFQQLEGQISKCKDSPMTTFTASTQARQHRVTQTDSCLADCPPTTILKAHKHTQSMQTSIANTTWDCIANFEDCKGVQKHQAKQQQVSRNRLSKD